MQNRVEIVFDGDCGLCQTLVAWAKRRDRKGLCTFTPSSQCTWPDAHLQPFEKSVVLRRLDGQTFSGASAVFRTLAELPGILGLLGKTFVQMNRVKMVHRITDRIYYFVAEHRRSFSHRLVQLHLLDESCVSQGSGTPSV